MPSDPIAEAQALYQESLDATSQQRAQIGEDLAFSDPANPDQWDTIIRAQRETDPGGARPCLVFDQVGQYVANVAGQVESNPPALHALPVGDGADKKVAEQLDGFFRHIEHVSRAKQHYARAETSAARAGVGYLIVRPEYVNRALNWQEPRISSEGDPLRVILDPWSVELDGSDASFGYLLTPLSHREFERQFGKDAKKVSFADEEQRTSIDPRESIVVVEQWRKVETTKRMVICTDVAQGDDEVAVPEDELAEKLKDPANTVQPKRGPDGAVKTYTDKVQTVKWCRMSGVEYLTEETEYPASGIGIVPVYGYVGWSNGRMNFCGIPRRALNAQRSYNYHMSEMHVHMGQGPKSPWLADIRAIKGLEALWDRASVDSRAFLPYNGVAEDGSAIVMPQRMPLAVNLQNHLSGAQQALHDIEASIGMYQANLGAPSNETSGVAIDARKQQGEASTSHFPSHLAAGLGQVGKLCMEMIPRLMDSRRQIRTLGIDETPGSVILDPEQQQAVQETDAGLSINPNVGQYDVRIVVGASFSTQRAQAQSAFTEMMRANPAIAPAIAPLWAQTLDIPHADKLAQALTAVAPPEVRAVLDPEGDKQPKTADLMAKLTQTQQALQEAIQHANDAQRDAFEAQAKAHDKTCEEEAKKRELQIQAYDAKTNRLKVTGANEAQIQAIVADLVGPMLAQPEPLGGEVAEQQEPIEQQEPQDWQAQTFPMQQPEPPEPGFGEVLPEGEEMLHELPEPEPEPEPVEQAVERLQQTVEKLIEVMQAPRQLVRGPDGRVAGIQ
jgi:hypothetical protein